VNSLPKTVARQRRDCDLNPGPSAPESSTLTTRLPSHPQKMSRLVQIMTRSRSETAIGRRAPTDACTHAQADGQFENITSIHNSHGPIYTGCARKARPQTHGRNSVES